MPPPRKTQRRIRKVRHRMSWLMHCSWLFNIHLNSLNEPVNINGANVVEDPPTRHKPIITVTQLQGWS